MTMTLTKAAIAKKICSKSNISQQSAKRSLDIMLSIMKKALKTEHEVLLSGFGKFETFKKKTRKGRNPHTGEEITLKEHDTLTFRISRKFKEHMKKLH